MTPIPAPAGSAGRTPHLGRLVVASQLVEPPQRRLRIETAIGWACAVVAAAVYALY